MLQRNSGMVWIAAYPRSGNTWTRLFICNLAALLAGEKEEVNFNNFLRSSPWDAQAEHYQKYIKVDPVGGVNAIKDMASVRHLVLRDFAETKDGLVFAKTHWLLGKAFGHNTFDFFGDRRRDLLRQEPARRFDLASSPHRQARRLRDRTYGHRQRLYRH